MRVHRTNLPLVWLALTLLRGVSAQTPTPDPIAEADATCKQVLAEAPPAPAGQNNFKSDCDSSAYYFGIGRPRDFAAARQCAYAELANPSPMNSNIFAGPGVLSMVYANGEDTPRNTALARRFVCEAWSAPAELQIRLDLLDQIDKSTTPPHFNLCQTATSGLSQGWCQSIDSRSARTERDRQIERLTSNLSPGARTAFDALKRAEAAYERVRAQNEVDLSGSARAAFEWQEEDSVADEFLANLRSLQQPAPSSPADPRAADEQLNAAYALVRQSLPAQGGQAFGKYGTTGFDGVQKTERAWLQLRDRWMDFVHIAYPAYPGDTFLVHLIEQRTKQLRSLVS